MLQFGSPGISSNGSNKRSSETMAPTKVLFPHGWFKRMRIRSPSQIVVARIAQWRSLPDFELSKHVNRVGFSVPSCCEHCGYYEIVVRYGGFLYGISHAVFKLTYLLYYTLDCWKLIVILCWSTKQKPPRSCASISARALKSGPWQTKASVPCCLFDSNTQEFS